VNLNVPKKEDNDNVDEFKQLFNTAKVANFSKAAPKRVIDLTYNPGQLPDQQPQQHQAPQKQLSLFDNDDKSAMRMPA